MELSKLVSYAETIGLGSLFLIVLARQIKTGARDVWRSEAEAQTARADRQEKAIAELISEVKALRDENAELRVEIAALRRENTDLREHIDALLNQ